MTKDHADSVRWLNAKKRMLDTGRAPLDDGIDSMVHTEQMRILSCLKVVYFCECEDIPLDKYPSHWKLLCELNTPNMLAFDEYGSYVNPVSGREMMLAIRDHVKKHILADICASPFYSVLIDESTDRTMEKHLIVYVTYVSNRGKGRANCCFVELLPIDNADAKSIFDALTQFLEDIVLNVNKLIAIATDGASVMTNKLWQQRMDLCLILMCMLLLTKLLIKSWLGKSGKRHEELWKIMSEYDLGDVKALQIYSEQWLSRGKVMERLVNIMPAILEQWNYREKKWYEYATMFVVQFMIHLSVNILVELNKLNVEFKRQEMDMTTIGALIDLTFEKLTRRYLTNDAKNFGVGSHYLSTFLGMAKEGKLVYIYANGKSHSHALKFKPIIKVKKGKKATDTSECEEKDIENEDVENLDLNAFPKEIGSLDECIAMAKSYVQNI
ncbi:hypothetical protein L7F22_048779 [Adiantum nelumboides]|nr:hypothetical protein [Adiantum nelumboides]